MCVFHLVLTMRKCFCCLPAVLRAREQATFQLIIPAWKHYDFLAKPHQVHKFQIVHLISGVQIAPQRGRIMSELLSPKRSRLPYRVLSTSCTPPNLGQLTSAACHPKLGVGTNKKVWLDEPNCLV